MDKEQEIYLDNMANRLANLSTAERTSALTQLFNLRTAAVEDFSNLGNNWQHWDTALGCSEQPENIRSLIRDLTQLTEEELAIVSARTFARGSVAYEKIWQTSDDKEGAGLQPQLEAGAKQSRESYMAAKQSLDMKHKARIAEKMKDVRDAIEHGISAGQDVTPLEEVFTRIEQEFWEQHHDSATTGINIKRAVRQGSSSVESQTSLDKL